MLTISRNSTGEFDSRRLIRLHDECSKKSRTYVNGIKAVRLDNYGMKNSTIRQEGDNKYVVRLYDTDIVTFDTFDNTATITVGEWFTATTMDRVWAATGVCLYNLNGTLTKFTRRMGVETSLGHAPFIDGVKFDMATGQILNWRDIPDDVRKFETKVTKQGSAKFKKLWAPVAERLKREIKMGHIAMRVTSEPEFSAGRDQYKLVHPTYIPLTTVLDPEVDLPTLENALLYHTRTHVWGEKHINPALTTGLEAMRKHFRDEWAKANNETERVGGEVLSQAGYFRKGDQ